MGFGCYIFLPKLCFKNCFAHNTIRIVEFCRRKDFIFMVKRLDTSTTLEGDGGLQPLYAVLELETREKNNLIILASIYHNAIELSCIIYLKSILPLIFIFFSLSKHLIINLSKCFCKFNMSKKSIGLFPENKYKLQKMYLRSKEKVYSGIID